MEYLLQESICQLSCNLEVHNGMLIGSDMQMIMAGRSLVPVSQQRSMHGHESRFKQCQQNTSACMSGFRMTSVTRKDYGDSAVSASEKGMFSAESRRLQAPILLIVPPFPLLHFHVAIRPLLNHCRYGQLGQGVSKIRSFLP